MKRMISKVFVLSALIFSFALSANAQDERVNALYVESFAKSIEWPDKLVEKTFVIGVYGEENAQFKKVFLKKKKRIGNLPVELKFFTDLNEAPKCHILYVPMDHTDALATIVQSCKVNSTLIVTCNPGFKEGAVINIDVDALDLEINTNEIEKRGMRVSSNLKAMATEI